MDYSNLSEQQLLDLATTEKTHNKEINKEWRKRYGMQFPYKLSSDGHIENKLIKAFVGDRECDRLVLDQAKRLRNQRKTEVIT